MQKLYQSDIQTGVYRHYKGNHYLVYDVAVHSETMEELVVYRPLYGDQALWVRPREMFYEKVEIDGELVDRFAFIGLAGDEAPELKVSK